MDALLGDLRFGIRMLVKRPGLSLAVIVTFGLGIGLTTTVFSIVNGALFKGLPFEDAGRIVLVGQTNPARNIDFMWVHAHDYVDMAAQQTVFESMGAISVQPVNLAEEGARPERFTGGFFTPGVFNLLRVQPVLGRTFREGDARPGAAPVIIISYELWQDRFHGAADVLERTVRANGRPGIVIGVMPEGFAFPFREQLWLPLEVDLNARPRGQDAQYMTVARLRDGVSMDAARAQVATVARRLEEEYPDSNRGVGATVQTFTQNMVGDQIAGLLLTMLGAVIGVLLIACANVANLLLARSSVRTREVAVRTALGARRGLVIRQLVTEVMILAILGGALGIALGMAGVAWFDTVIQVDPPPYWIRFDMDIRVLLFVTGVTLLASLASSLFPAVQTSRTDVVGALKDEGRGASGLRMGRFTAGLVIAEVAISCALLIASGLMVRSVVQLRTVPMPFTTANIFTARINLPLLEYPDTAARVGFYEELLPRLAAIPGVDAATLSDGLPASGNGTRVFQVEGASYAADDEFPVAREGIVTPGYFQTFEAHVLRGRAFQEADRPGALPVAVVNESFIRRFFPDGDAIGRRIRMGVRDTTAHWLTVIGVVPDLYMEGIGNNDASPAGFYIPISQSGVGNFVSIALRTRGAPAQMTDQVRAAVNDIDRNLPIFDVQSMTDVIQRQTWFYRVFGTLFMAFGSAALFLAAIGLYGVMSFSVSRRAREMGIRMALGAEARALVRLVLRKGIVQLAIGLVIGLGLAALATTPLQFVLYDVQPRDPVVFSAVVATLAAIGFAASLIPAWRVTRVDPVTALNAE